MLSEKRMFILKLLFILLPMGAITSVPFIFAVRMKEALSYEQILAVQEAQCPLVMFGPRTITGRIHFKVYNAIEREPEVLVIGNSLMVTYRSALLNKNPSAFYNAAANGTSINTSHFMVREILNQTDNLPSVILLGLSPSDFANANIAQDVAQPEIDDPINLQTIYDSGINSLISAYEAEYNFNRVVDLLRTRFSPSGELLYGHTARFATSGYRNDGSYRFGSLTIENAAVGRQLSYETWLEPENTVRAVIPSDEVMPNAMYHTEQILQLAQQNNVFVIGLLPSYMPSIEYYMAESGDYTYLPQAIEQLNILFESYGFGFYSQDDLPNMTYEDEVYFDGRHYSEAAAAEIYLQFLADYPDLLGEYSSAEWIQTQIEQAENPFDFFNNVICDL